jgi:hypothetical protein
MPLRASQNQRRLGVGGEGGRSSEALPFEVLGEAGSTFFSATFWGAFQGAGAGSDFHRTPSGPGPLQTQVRQATLRAVGWPGQQDLAPRRRLNQHPGQPPLGGFHGERSPQPLEAAIRGRPETQHRRSLAPGRSHCGLIPGPGYRQGDGNEPLEGFSQGQNPQHPLPLAVRGGKTPHPGLRKPGGSGARTSGGRNLAVTGAVSGMASSAKKRVPEPTSNPFRTSWSPDKAAATRRVSSSATLPRGSGGAQGQVGGQKHPAVGQAGLGQGPNSRLGRGNGDQIILQAAGPAEVFGPGARVEANPLRGGEHDPLPRGGRVATTTASPTQGSIKKCSPSMGACWG